MHTPFNVLGETWFDHLSAVPGLLAGLLAIASGVWAIADHPRKNTQRFGGALLILWGLAIMPINTLFGAATTFWIAPWPLPPALDFVACSYVRSCSIQGWIQFLIPFASLLFLRAYRARFGPSQAMPLWTALLLALPYANGGMEIVTLPILAIYLLARFVRRAHVVERPWLLLALTLFTAAYFGVTRWIDDASGFGVGMPEPGYLVLFGLFAALFALEARTSPRAAFGRSASVLSLGFWLPVFHYVTMLHAVVFASAGGLARYADEWRFASLGFVLEQAFLLGLVLSTPAITLYSTLHRADERRAAHAAKYSAILIGALLPVTAWGIAGVFLPRTVFASLLYISVAGFATGLFLLAFPVAVLVALLRHRILEFDARLQAALLASVLALAFLVIASLVSAFVSDPLGAGDGALLGLLLAALLVAGLFRPLRSFAEWLARAAFPSARRVRDMTEAERRDAYRDYCESAHADGVVSPHERARLDDLRARLALEEAVAQQLELETLHHPRRSPTAGPAVVEASKLET